MLIAVITGPDLESAKRQVEKACVDILEFRLDYFDDINIVSTLMDATQLPIILTLRSQAQGGNFSGSLTEKIALYHQMTNWAPAYIDVDTEVDSHVMRQLRHEFPHVKWIYSHHNMTRTPYNLAEIFTNMQAANADFYKVVTYAHTGRDALHMLKFMRELGQDNLIAFCMGEVGQWTRVVSPIFGCANMLYLATDVDAIKAKGQLTVDAWHQEYYAPSLNPNTQLYALIGSPVAQSIGHIFHNKVFKDQNRNAVYVKILLTPEELPQFFEVFKDSALKGLSVTMPLKSAVIPFIDILQDSAAAANAVNTIIFGDTIIGKNTDGEGALQALRQKTTIENKNIIILGVGNTARAIAIVAKNQGAMVTMMARNVTSQQDWAKNHDINIQAFDNLLPLAQDYDALINATPVGMAHHGDDPDWLAPALFLPGRVILDCVMSENETRFLRLAKAQNCYCVTGKEMFFAQAQAQFC